MGFTLLNLWAFLNSSFFVAVITLSAGFIAYWLYRKKNKDFKKDTANILLLEIQNAERLLKVAKERMRKDGVLIDNAYVMPTESWSKYKYMFVRNFDRDEWDTLSAFYDKCRSYDESVGHKSVSFIKNEAEIRANMHRVTADYIKELIDKNPVIDDSERDLTVTKIDLFQDRYLGLPESLTLYQPNKPIIDAKAHLEGISDNLSQTSIGTKLKLLANLK